MSIIKLKKINDEFVHPVRFQTGANDKRKFKGEALFDEGYFSCFCLAKKKSGKSTVLVKIVKSVCTSQCTVIDICSTADKDKLHLAIKAYCKSKHIPYLAYTSLKEDGVDIIDMIVKKLEEEAKIKENPDSDEEEDDKQKGGLILFNSSDESEEEDDVKTRALKFQSPKFLIILDDLSNELRYPIVATLLKKHRHFEISCVVSSQFANDLKPDALKQLDVCLIFAGEPVEKLEKLHKDFDLAINFDLFLKLYYNATKLKYGFLYVNIRNEEFRRNFTHKYDIPATII